MAATARWTVSLSVISDDGDNESSASFSISSEWEDDTGRVSAMECIAGDMGNALRAVKKGLIPTLDDKSLAELFLDGLRE